MRNNGLFSTLFIDRVKSTAKLDDMARGRMATLAHNWKNRNNSSSSTLWDSFIKQALGNLAFIPGNRLSAEGLYPVHKDWNMNEYLCLVYLVEPDADLNDTSAGCFWPSKLLTVIKEKKLNWGILTDGALWRLYTLKTAKPYEDYVELDLAAALEKDDITEYALFERFFHAESFAPEENDDESDEDRKAAKDVGLYRCRLDQDKDKSEDVLLEMVKTPLLVQVDEVLQYICNGFIADTDKSGEEYSEEERRDIFESAVKMLYRCMFLFYAESRKLLPSEKEKESKYHDELSIHHICEEARKFKWNKRTDTTGYDLWNHLKGLVNAVNEGDRAYGIMGYNGGLFDDKQELFLGKHKLRNDYLARALYLMAFVEPGIKQSEKDEYRFPFEDLEVRHLGELYENILEFNVILADADRIRRRTKDGFTILLASETKRQPDDTIIQKGQVYFGQSANERKQTGSYYTPESLVGFLVEKSVIDPLKKQFEENYLPRVNEFLDQADKGTDSKVRRGAILEAERLITRFIENDVLKFKVCDPAMGSGHFLLSASNRMTNLIIELFSRLPAIAAKYSEQTCQPNHWRRLITRHCIYGVDLNPLAVNLGKLSLWLNCFATDHKLTFLDHRLRAGNSLIGIKTLDCLKSIPKRKKEFKKKDTIQELPKLDTFEVEVEWTAKVIANIARIDEDDTDMQKSEYDAARDALERLTPLADLYTAYLMVDNIIPDTYQRFFQKTATGNSSSFFDDDLKIVSDQVCDLRNRHKFFHWPIEFPDVFNSADSAGFNATIGNPPWDVMQPNSHEFYINYDPDFRKYDKQKALAVIKILHAKFSEIQDKWGKYEECFSQASKYCKEPIAYDSLQSGKIDLYKAFLERFFSILKPNGYEGIVTPSGFYTDEGCLPLRKMFFENSKIDFIYCFENRKAIFNIHRSFKFILFSTIKEGKTESFKCAFMKHDPELLRLIDKNALVMNVKQVRKFSPDSLSIMEFKSHRDIDITTQIYGSWPLLGEKPDNTWNVRFSQEFNMTSDSHLFLTQKQLLDMNAVELSCSRFAIINKSICIDDLKNASLEQLRMLDEKREIKLYLPLYEGKQIWHFDGHFDYFKYWVNWELCSKQSKINKEEAKQYRLGYRDIAASTNERTLISCVIPPLFHGNKIPTVIPKCNITTKDILYPQVDESIFLMGLLNSFAIDYLIRQKISTTLNFFYIYSLPAMRFKLNDRYFTNIIFNCSRLLCVSEEYSALWKDVYSKFNHRAAKYHNYGPIEEQHIRTRLAEEANNLTSEWTPACGVYDRTADRRDTGDRAQLRAEIDAYVAHLYGLSRDDFSYILDTFPVLQRKELAIFGEFKTKRKCLEEFDRIGEEI
ncbi:MAG: DNA methyltransferase [Lentisphaerota bacterium]